MFISARFESIVYGFYPEAARWRVDIVFALLAILVMILLVVLESVRGGHEGDQYVPPRLENGRVVPGHFVSEPETETGDAPEDDEPQ